MPIIFNQKTITLPTSGTISLGMTEPQQKYVVESGAITLLGNINIQEGGTAVEGTTYNFKYQANVTLSGSSIFFFGSLMPSTLVDKTCSIVAYYNGTAWDVQYIPDLDQNGAIPPSVLPQDAAFISVNAFGGGGIAYTDALLTNDATNPLQYRLKADETLEWRGQMDKAAGALGSTLIFTMTGDYRPVNDKKYIIQVYNVTTAAYENALLTIGGSAGANPGEYRITWAVPANAYEWYADGFFPHTAQE